MRYSQVHAAGSALFKATTATPIYLSGAPGLGKTTLAYDIAKDLGIAKEGVFIFRPSLHDPVDLMGVPNVADGVTHWATPTFLKQVNDYAEKHGNALLLWDEMAQAVVMMQNAIAGLLLDRQVGDFKLHPSVIQMATGNRAKDKAGANRIVSQLANRVMHLEIEPHLDDWCAWALDNKIDVTLISFLRYKPSHLCDFDPDRFSNPTPRTWEKVAQLPTNIGRDLYHSMVSGLVSEGVAAEYIGFREVAEKIPNPDAILLNPKDAPCPTDDPAVLYALTGALSVRASKNNIDNMVLYTNRMPPEFQVLVMKDAMRIDNTIASTNAFIQWVTKNASVLV